MNQNIFSILLVFIGLFVGIIMMLIINYLKALTQTKKSENILKKAREEADKIKKDSLVEAREEVYKLKIEAEKEIKEKKGEIKEIEERLLNRENNIDRRDQSLQNREQFLDEKENNLIIEQKEIQKEQVELENLKTRQIELLEEIAGYSKEKAKKLVLKEVEDMMSREISNLIKEKEEEAKLVTDKKAKDLLVSSMQRYAASVVSAQTVTVVDLPTDEVKGRIIGREGRNIRTIEAVTGVDLIIDDTPETIVLSCFDPIRREIARLTIEELLKDGRIHPTKIEEIYENVSNDMKLKILEYGNNALFDLGITKMDPELIELIGRLNFRTSYGQNALKHSIEVANLSGIIASEIGENEILAKRAGLLHDIGKSIDYEIEGSHVEIGANLAKKYKENEIVINAIESHHGDKEANNLISVIVAIADTLSASRPGARNDSLENYIKRLQELENIASNIEGVEKSFAIQAGRELRVIVKPEQISDAESYKIARTIKNKIEDELQYPGTIKVTVVREIRAIEEAK